MESRMSHPVIGRFDSYFNRGFIIDEFVNDHLCSYRETKELLQHSCQQIITEIIEYLSFLLLEASAYYYIYSILKMAEEIINELLLEVPFKPLESDVK